MRDNSFFVKRLRKMEQGKRIKKQGGFAWQKESHQNPWR
jgi:hypothetical protein